MEIYKIKLRQIEKCCQSTAHFNLNTDNFGVLSLVLTLTRACSRQQGLTSAMTG